MVSSCVRQPVWQVGQVIGPVAVTVGVVGHKVFGAGTVIVLTSSTMQSGCGGQTVCKGHESTHRQLFLVRHRTIS